MPITGLSDRRRLPRLLKIRLGVRRNGGSDGPPKEVDYFVFKKEDGATDEILKLYSGTPKAIRMMLPFEVDALDPKSGDELVWNENNRAYGRAHGLKCKGHGGSASEPDFAETDDEEWAKRIAGNAKAQPVKLPNGRYRIPCWGRDCPKYAATDQDGKKLPGHDADAACKAVVVLRAFLLHPTDDVSSKDYCRVLGVAEIASGSRNTMIDVRSSFEVVKLYTGGRTAAVPFKLIRRPMKTTSTGPMHFTLTIEPTPEEWQRFGMTPPSQVFLPEAKRAELAALAAADVNFDSVKDLLPRALPAADIPAESEPLGELVTADRDQVLDDAQRGDDPDPDPELERELSQLERDELKQLCGGVPGQPQTLEKFREMVAAAYSWFDTWHAEGEGDRPPLGLLQVKHARFIKEQVLAEAPASQQVIDIDPDEAA